MDVVFYSHNKRINSLKLPTQGTTIPCVLKDSTSVVSPSLELRVNANPSYNYAYIADFGRYYYVNEWIYYRGLWTCTLSVDVLTSWRAYLLNTTAYIEHSSSNYSTDYTDSRVVPTQKKTYAVEELPLSAFNSTGCYILSLISVDSNGYNGACAVYALTQEELTGFSELITSQSFLDGIWESLKNAFNNPFEAIVSCRWIPFSVDDLKGEQKIISVAYASTGIYGKLLTSNFTGQAFNLVIPKRTTARTFLDASPYVTALLYLPFVGVVSLDIDAYYNSDTFSVYMQCDVVTGDIVYTIGSSFTNTTSTYSGNCATQIPLSNNMVDSLGMITSTAGVIGGVISTIRAIKNPLSSFTGLMAKETAVQGSLLATTGATFGAIRSAEIHTHTNGALSSRIGARVGLLAKAIIIRSEVLEDVFSVDRIALFGLPCNKTLKLSSLSGYCQCSGASVSAPATDSELSAINDFVNSGIYIE